MVLRPGYLLVVQKLATNLPRDPEAVAARVAKAFARRMSERSGEAWVAAPRKHAPKVAA